MNHSFNIEDAKKYGVECAIILENLRFWIAKNKANNRHFYDGKYWTYNSVRALAELFPYWTINQIRRYIDKLQSLGVISCGNYNQSPYDMTKWFCVNEQIDLANLPNENGENDKCYTDINTDINNIYTKKQKTSIPNDFVISEKVKKWAIEKKFYNIDKHFDFFVNACKAKGYKYVDWDRAFMNAISSNWAKIENKPTEKKLPEGWKAAWFK